MLVLSREKGAHIMVETKQGLVTITVVEIRGKFVRIGIEAPAEMPVHRAEVYEVIHREEKPQ